MDPQIFQEGVLRTPKFENLDTSLYIYKFKTNASALIFSLSLYITVSYETCLCALKIYGSGVCALERKPYP